MPKIMGIKSDLDRVWSSVNRLHSRIYELHGMQNQLIFKPQIFIRMGDNKSQLTKTTNAEFFKLLFYLFCFHGIWFCSSFLTLWCRFPIINDIIITISVRSISATFSIIILFCVIIHLRVRGLHPSNL